MGQHCVSTRWPILPHPIVCISTDGGAFLTPLDLGGSANTRLVYAWMGLSHTLLVDSERTVWATGANSLGQCGAGHVPAQVGSFKQVPGLIYEGENEEAVMASCGVTFGVVPLCIIPPIPYVQLFVQVTSNRAHLVVISKNGR
ncbi:hypothetical protein PQX77_009949 [Marasmius sp. AFHP31]|nr:hypothetical protein PQX77_009949 [Marasmius sp. AFHP31]